MVMYKIKIMGLGGISYQSKVARINPLFTGMATGLNFSGGSAGYGAPPAPSYGAPAPAPAPTPAPAPSYNAPAPAPSYNSFAKSRKVN